LKAVKNGSMTGSISNDTLTRFFWNCFWLLWVVVSILNGDMDS
jgi:hypothetical protein